MKIEACNLCGKTSGEWIRVLEPRGNRDSQIAFLVPAPTKEECSNALMESEAAICFAEILACTIDLDITKDVLCVPLTFCNTRLQIHSVKQCSTHVNRFIKDKKIVCIVGNAVYKGFFNQGSIPEMLYGRDYQIDDYKPRFFFFSDYKQLRELDEREYAPDVVYWQDRIRKEARLFGKFLNKFSKGR